VTTLFVVPCIYSLVVANQFETEPRPLPGEIGAAPEQPHSNAD
jgi:hypothetical protein